MTDLCATPFEKSESAGVKLTKTRQAKAMERLSLPRMSPAVTDLKIPPRITINSSKKVFTAEKEGRRKSSSQSLSPSPEKIEETNTKTRKRAEVNMLKIKGLMKAKALDTTYCSQSALVRKGISSAAITPRQQTNPVESPAPIGMVLSSDRRRMHDRKKTMLVVSSSTGNLVQATRIMKDKLLAAVGKHDKMRLF